MVKAVATLSFKGMVISQLGGGRERTRSYRSELYATLETAVREADEGISCDFENSRSCNLSNRERENESTTTTRSVDYPSPILWFEEMRPADLDSYHAFHSNKLTEFVSSAARHKHCSSGTHQNRSLGFSRSSPQDETTPCAAGANVGCRIEQKEIAANVVAPLLRHTHVPSYGKMSVDGSIRPPARNGQPCQQGVDGQQQVILPTPFPVVSGVSNTMLSERASAISSQLEDGEEPRNCSPIHTDMEVNIKNTSNVKFPQPRRLLETAEDNAYQRATEQQSDELQQSRKVSPAASSAAGSLLLSQLSQGTQDMMSFPGLPSQVLISQKGDVDPWEEMEDDRAESESSFSEYAIQSPAMPSSSGVQCGDRSRITRDSDLVAQEKTVEDNPAWHIPSNAAVSNPAMSAPNIPQGDARARQYEALTNALRGAADHSELKATGEGTDQGRAQNEQEMMDIFSKSVGNQHFVLVSPEKILPRGVAGGRAGVVTLLEKHLARARERVPNGYSTRSLELACHVFSQPKVCVRIRPQDGREAASPLAWAKSTRASPGGHAEVVGVTSLVWEVLREKVKVHEAHGTTG